MSAIRYTVAPEGWRGSPVADRFQDLSLLLAGEDARVPSLAELNRRVRVDADMLVQLLRAKGYYDPLVDIDVRTVEGAPANRTVSVTVDAGPLYRFGRVDAPGLSIAADDPVDAERVQSAIADLRAGLPRSGFPFAEIGEVDILIDHETRTATLTLPVDRGPPARFGAIEVAGAGAPFDAAHVQRLARFAPGDAYDSDLVDDLRRALIATGLVGAVSIEPQPRGGDAVLLVEVEPAPPRTLAAQLSYDTEDGARIEASWQHRNLFPPEGALTGTFVLGTEEQLLSADFRRGNFRRRDTAIGARIAAFRETRDAFSARGHPHARLSGAGDEPDLAEGVDLSHRSRTAADRRARPLAPCWRRPLLPDLLHRRLSGAARL